MANKLADARRSLIRAKESAQQRLKELDDERCEIKASIKSLEAALKALGRSNQPQSTTRRSPAPNELWDEANDNAS